MTDTDIAVRLVRIFATTPDRLFDAWVVRENFCRWIGPEGVNCDVHAMDARVGGAYRLTMNIPDRPPMQIEGRYSVVDRPKRIAFTWTNAETGVGSDITIAFRAVPGGTEMVLTQTADFPPDIRESIRIGWNSAFNKLDRQLGAA